MPNMDLGMKICLKRCPDLETYTSDVSSIESIRSVKSDDEDSSDSTEPSKHVQRRNKTKPRREWRKTETPSRQGMRACSGRKIGSHSVNQMVRYSRSSKCELPANFPTDKLLRDCYVRLDTHEVGHYFDPVTETYKYPAQLSRKQGDSSQHGSQGEQKLYFQADSKLLPNEITKQTEPPKPLVRNAASDVSKDRPDNNSSHATSVLTSDTSPICKTDNPFFSSQNHLQELGTANCSKEPELEVNVSIETEKLEAEDSARPLPEHPSKPLALSEKFQNFDVSNKCIAKPTNKSPEDIKSKTGHTLTTVSVSLLSSENSQQPNTGVESVAKSEENVLPETQSLKAEVKVSNVEKVLSKCSLLPLESSESSHQVKSDGVENAEKSNIKTQSRSEFVANVRSLLPQCSFFPSQSLKKFQKLKSQDIKPVSMPKVSVLPKTQRKDSASISNDTKPSSENPVKFLQLPENVHCSIVKVKQELKTEDKLTSNIVNHTPHMSDCVQECVLQVTQKSNKTTGIMAQPDSSLFLKSDGNIVEDTESPRVIKESVTETEIINKLVPNSECQTLGSSDKLEMTNDVMHSTEDSDEETDYFNVLTRSPKKKHSPLRLNMSHSDTENSSDSNNDCNIEEPKSKEQVFCVNSCPSEKKELKASNKQVKPFKKVFIKTSPLLKCTDYTSDVKESKAVTEQLESVKMSAEISPSLKSGVCNSNLIDAKESKEVTKIVNTSLEISLTVCTNSHANDVTEECKVVTKQLKVTNMSTEVPLKPTLCVDSNVKEHCKEVKVVDTSADSVPDLLEELIAFKEEMFPNDSSESSDGSDEEISSDVDSTYNKQDITKNNLSHNNAKPAVAASSLRPCESDNGASKVENLIHSAAADENHAKQTEPHAAMDEKTAADELKSSGINNSCDSFENDTVQLDINVANLECDKSFLSEVVELSVKASASPLNLTEMDSGLDAESMLDAGNRESEGLRRTMQCCSPVLSDEDVNVGDTVKAKTLSSVNSEKLNDSDSNLLVDPGTCEDTQVLDPYAILVEEIPEIESNAIVEENITTELESNSPFADLAEELQELPEIVPDESLVDKELPIIEPQHTLNTNSVDEKSLSEEQKIVNEVSTVDGLEVSANLEEKKVDVNLETHLNHSCESQDQEINSKSECINSSLTKLDVNKVVNPPMQSIEEELKHILGMDSPCSPRSPENSTQVQVLENSALVKPVEENTLVTQLELDEDIPNATLKTEVQEEGTLSVTIFTTEPVTEEEKPFDDSFSSELLDPKADNFDLLEEGKMEDIPLYDNLDEELSSPEGEFCSDLQSNLAQQVKAEQCKTKEKLKGKSKTKQESKLLLSERKKFPQHKKVKSTFECAACNKKFNSKSRLCFHMKNMHLSHPGTCCSCEFENESIDSLMTHIRKVHREKNPKTLSYYNFLQQLRVLQKIHNNLHGKLSPKVNFPFLCVLCRCRFRLDIDFMVHRNTLAHRTREKLWQQYRMALKTVKTSSNGNQEHPENLHSNFWSTLQHQLSQQGTNNKTKRLSFKLVKKAVNLKHRSVVATTSLNPESETNKVLSKLKVRAKERSKIRLSKQSSSNKKYQCPECSKTFSHSSKLNLHIKYKEHKNSKQKINFQKKTDSLTPIPDIDIKHLSSSVWEKAFPFACDKCPNRFRTKSYIEKHMMTNKHPVTFYKRPDYIRTALKNIGLSVKQYKCHLCPRVTTCLWQLECHIVGTHLKSKDLKKSQVGKSDRPTYLCDYCGQTFKFLQTLALHVKTFHQETDKATELVKAKQEIKVKKQKFFCELCQMDLLFQKNYKAHLNSAKHASAAFRQYVLSASIKKNDPTIANDIAASNCKMQLTCCAVCTKKFKTQEELNSHIAQHLNLKPAGSRVQLIPVPLGCFYCNTCQETFQCLDDLNHHIYSTANHGNGHFEFTSPTTKEEIGEFGLDPNAVVHGCSYCDASFNSMFLLQRHEMSCHDIKVERVACDIAKDPDTEEETQNETFKPRQYHCKTCKYVTMSQIKFRQHLLTHKSRVIGVINVCALCNTQFSSLQELQSHLSETHSVKLNIDPPLTKKLIRRCYLCAKKFKSNSALQSHVQSEHPFQDQLHMCSICPYNTTMLYRLINHMETEHDSTVTPSPESEENFTCKSCAETFSDTVQLEAHITSEHSGKKSPKKYYYQCEYCDYSTNNAGIFSDHTLLWHSKNIKYTKLVENGKVKFKCAYRNCHYTCDKLNPCMSKHFKSAHSNNVKYKNTYQNRMSATQKIIKIKEKLQKASLARRKIKNALENAEVSRKKVVKVYDKSSCFGNNIMKLQIKLERCKVPSDQLKPATVHDADASNSSDKAEYLKVECNTKTNFYKCMSCPAAFPTYPQMQEHLQSHNSIEDNSVDRCIDQQELDKSVKQECSISIESQKVVEKHVETEIIPDLSSAEENFISVSKDILDNPETSLQKSSNTLLQSHTTKIKTETEETAVFTESQCIQNTTKHSNKTTPQKQNMKSQRFKNQISSPSKKSDIHETPPENSDLGVESLEVVKHSSTAKALPQKKSKLPRKKSLSPRKSQNKIAASKCNLLAKANRGDSSEIGESEELNQETDIDTLSHETQSEIVDTGLDNLAIKKMPLALKTSLQKKCKSPRKKSLSPQKSTRNIAETESDKQNGPQKSETQLKISDSTLHNLEINEVLLKLETSTPRKSGSPKKNKLSPKKTKKISASVSHVESCSQMSETCHEISDAILDNLEIKDVASEIETSRQRKSRSQKKNISSPKKIKKIAASESDVESCSRMSESRPEVFDIDLENLEVNEVSSKLEISPPRKNRSPKKNKLSPKKTKKIAASESDVQSCSQISESCPKVFDTDLDNLEIKDVSSELETSPQRKSRSPRKMSLSPKKTKKIAASESDLESYSQISETHHKISDADLDYLEIKDIASEIETSHQRKSRSPRKLSLSPEKPTKKIMEHETIHTSQINSDPSNLNGICKLTKTMSSHYEDEEQAEVDMNNLAKRNSSSPRKASAVLIKNQENESKESPTIEIENPTVKLESLVHKNENCFTEAEQHEIQLKSPERKSIRNKSSEAVDDDRLNESISNQQIQQEIVAIKANSATKENSECIETDLPEQTTVAPTENHGDGTGSMSRTSCDQAVFEDVTPKLRSGSIKRCSASEELDVQCDDTNKPKLGKLPKLDVYSSNSNTMDSVSSRKVKKKSKCSKPDKKKMPVSKDYEVTSTEISVKRCKIKIRVPPSLRTTNTVTCPSQELIDESSETGIKEEMPSKVLGSKSSKIQVKAHRIGVPEMKLEYQNDQTKENIDLESTNVEFKDKLVQTKIAKKIPVAKKVTTKKLKCVRNRIKTTILRSKKKSLPVLVQVGRNTRNSKKEALMTAEQDQPTETTGGHVLKVKQKRDKPRKNPVETSGRPRKNLSETKGIKKLKNPVKTRDRPRKNPFETRGRPRKNLVESEVDHENEITNANVGERSDDTLTDPTHSEIPECVRETVELTKSEVVENEEQHIKPRSIKCQKELKKSRVVKMSMKPNVEVLPSEVVLQPTETMTKKSRSAKMETDLEETSLTVHQQTEPIIKNSKSKALQGKLPPSASLESEIQTTSPEFGLPQTIFKTKKSKPKSIRTKIPPSAAMEPEMPDETNTQQAKSIVKRSKSKSVTLPEIDLPQTNRCIKRSRSKSIGDNTPSASLEPVIHEILPESGLPQSITDIEGSTESKPIHAEIPQSTTMPPGMQAIPSEIVPKLRIKPVIKKTKSKLIHSKILPNTALKSVTQATVTETGPHFQFKPVTKKSKSVKKYTKKTSSAVSEAILEPGLEPEIKSVTKKSKSVKKSTKETSSAESETVTQATISEISPKPEIKSVTKKSKSVKKSTKKTSAEVVIPAAIPDIEVTEEHQIEVISSPIRYDMSAPSCSWENNYNPIDWIPELNDDMIEASVSDTDNEHEVYVESSTWLKRQSHKKLSKFENIEDRDSFSCKPTKNATGHELVAGTKNLQEDSNVQLTLEQEENMSLAQYLNVDESRDIISPEKETALSQASDAILPDKSQDRKRSISESSCSLPSKVPRNEIKDFDIPNETKVIEKLEEKSPSSDFKFKLPQAVELNPLQCDVCKKILSSVRNVKRHKDDVHKEGGKGVHKKVYRNKRRKRSNGKKRKVIPLVNCDFCQKTLSSKYSLIRHMKLCHQIEDLSDKCTQISEYTTYLRSHKRDIKEEEKYSDTTIDTTESEESFSLNTSFSSTELNDSLFTCCICSKQFKAKKSLSHHLKRIHQIHSKIWQCKNCNFCTFDYESLQNHGNIHPSNTEADGSVPPQEVKLENVSNGKEVEEFTEQTTESVMEHSNPTQETDARPFSCPTCNLSYKLKDSLRRHIRKKHPVPISMEMGSSQDLTITKYKSSVDANMSLIRNTENIEVANENSLTEPTNHVAKHDETNIAITDINEAYLNTESINERNVDCDEVSVENIPTSLEPNIQSNDKRDLRSDLNAKSSHDSPVTGTLKMHLNITTKCEVCGKIFKHTKSLKKHVLKFHRQKKHKFSCQLCKRKTFSSNKILKKHTQKYHKFAENPNSSTVDNNSESMSVKPDVMMVTSQETSGNTDNTKSENSAGGMPEKVKNSADSSIDVGSEKPENLICGTVNDLSNSIDSPRCDDVKIVEARNSFDDTFISSPEKVEKSTESIVAESGKSESSVDNATKLRNDVESLKCDEGDNENSASDAVGDLPAELRKSTESLNYNNDGNGRPRNLDNYMQNDLPTELRKSTESLNFMDAESVELESSIDDACNALKLRNSTESLNCENLNQENSDSGTVSGLPAGLRESNESINSIDAENVMSERSDDDAVEMRNSPESLKCDEDENENSENSGSDTHHDSLAKMMNSTESPNNDEDENLNLENSARDRMSGLQTKPKNTAEPLRDAENVKSVDDAAELRNSTESLNCSEDGNVKSENLESDMCNYLPTELRESTELLNSVDAENVTLIDDAEEMRNSTESLNCSEDGNVKSENLESDICNSSPEEMGNSTDSLNCKDRNVKSENLESNMCNNSPAEPRNSTDSSNCSEDGSMKSSDMCNALPAELREPTEPLNSMDAENVELECSINTASSALPEKIIESTKSSNSNESTNLKSENSAFDTYNESTECLNYNDDGDVKTDNLDSDKSNDLPAELGNSSQCLNCDEGDNAENSSIGTHSYLSVESRNSGDFVNCDDVESVKSENSVFEAPKSVINFSEKLRNSTESLNLVDTESFQSKCSVGRGRPKRVTKLPAKLRGSNESLNSTDTTSAMPENSIDSGLKRVTELHTKLRGSNESLNSIGSVMSESSIGSRPKRVTKLPAKLRGSNESLNSTDTTSVMPENSIDSGLKRVTELHAKLRGSNESLNSIGSVMSESSIGSRPKRVTKLPAKLRGSNESLNSKDTTSMMPENSVDGGPRKCMTSPVKLGKSTESVSSIASSTESGNGREKRKIKPTTKLLESTENKIRSLMNQSSCDDTDGAAKKRKLSSKKRDHAETLRPHSSKKKLKSKRSSSSAVVNTEKLTCQECSMEFNFVAERDDHVSAAHPSMGQKSPAFDTTKLHCRECLVHFDCMEISDHYTTVHGVLERTYVCIICSYTTVVKYRLEKHMLVHL